MLPDVYSLIWILNGLKDVNLMMIIWLTQYYLLSTLGGKTYNYGKDKIFHGFLRKHSGQYS